jgi:hypothetical protein
VTLRRPEEDVTPGIFGDAVAVELTSDCIPHDGTTVDRGDPVTGNTSARRGVVIDVDLHGAQDSAMMMATMNEEIPT